MAETEKKIYAPKDAAKGVRATILDSLTSALAATNKGVSTQLIREKLDVPIIERLIDKISEEVSPNRGQHYLDKLLEAPEITAAVESFGTPSTDQKKIQKKTPPRHTTKTGQSQHQAQPTIQGGVNQQPTNTKTTSDTLDQNTPSTDSRETLEQPTKTPGTSTDTDKADDDGADTSVQDETAAQNARQSENTEEDSTLANTDDADNTTESDMALADTMPDDANNMVNSQNGTTEDGRFSAPPVTERSAPDAQLAENQIKQQQYIHAMSKQQLAARLQQLQQQKRELQKELLDKQETKTAFGIDQAALFMPALTTVAYIIDLIDITEFVAPVLDAIIAAIALYWRVTRVSKLKIFYLKKLPVLLAARLLGMIPFVSYISPELIEEIKTFMQRVNKFRKAAQAIKPLEKQIESIEKQIQQIQKQLKDRSFMSRMKRFAGRGN